MVMGNVNGSRNDEASPSGTKSEVGEEFMEYAQAYGSFPEPMVQSPPHSHRAYQSPLFFTPQVPGVPLRRPNEMMRIQRSNALTQNATQNEEMLSKMGIPAMITWSYDGKEVAIEGSWDNWQTREFLQKSGKDFTVMKVLPSGVYHYQFIVDGQWRYSPDVPLESDDVGNVFNVLNLQGYVPEEVLDNISGSEPTSSPVSSYNNSPFSLEDSNEKVPELPALLEQHPPLDQPSLSGDSPESRENPSPAVLNHLYIEKGCTRQSLVAVSSTHRFRSKYVTVALYKPLKKAND